MKSLLFCCVLCLLDTACGDDDDDNIQPDSAPPVPRLDLGYFDQSALNGEIHPRFEEPGFMELRLVVAALPAEMAVKAEVSIVRAADGVSILAEDVALTVFPDDSIYRDVARGTSSPFMICDSLSGDGTSLDFNVVVRRMDGSVYLEGHPRELITCLDNPDCQVACPSIAGYDGVIDAAPP